MSPGAMLFENKLMCTFTHWLTPCVHMFATFEHLCSVSHWCNGPLSVGWRKDLCADPCAGPGNPSRVCSCCCCWLPEVGRHKSRFPTLEAISRLIRR